jgi:hypothetical protein
MLREAFHASNGYSGLRRWKHRLLLPSHLGTFLPTTWYFRHHEEVRRLVAARRDDGGVEGEGQLISTKTQVACWAGLSGSTITSTASSKGRGSWQRVWCGGGLAGQLHEIREGEREGHGLH